MVITIETVVHDRIQSTPPDKLSTFTELNQTAYICYGSKTNYDKPKELGYDKGIRNSAYGNIRKRGGYFKPCEQMFYKFLV